MLLKCVRCGTSLQLSRFSSISKVKWLESEIRVLIYMNPTIQTIDFQLSQCIVFMSAFDCKHWNMNYVIDPPKRATCTFRGINYVILGHLQKRKRRHTCTMFGNFILKLLKKSGLLINVYCRKKPAAPLGLVLTNAKMLTRASSKTMLRMLKC